MESWQLRVIVIIALIVLLFGVFLADVFGPADFSSVAYIAPILVCLGGLVADAIIRSNGKGGSDES